MLDFIIYDSKERYLAYKKIIDKIMMNFDIDYQTLIYEENHLKKKNFKIYILNVNSRKDSGLDIAFYIRNNLKDWQSMLIFVSDYPSLELELLNLKLMYIDYITENKEEKIKTALKIALKNYSTRPKTISFNYKTIYYQVPLTDIVYIEKELDTKRCIIKTDDKKILIPGTLNQLLNKLDSRFLKSNRSYIINLDKVVKYDTKTNLMEFSTGENLEVVSREKRKEVVAYFRRKI